MTDRLLDAQFRSDLTRIRANARVEATRRAEEQKIRDELRSRRSARIGAVLGSVSAIAATVFAWRHRGRGKAIDTPQPRDDSVLPS